MGEWKPIDDLEEQTVPLRVRTCGFLVKETKELVILASNVSGETNEGVRHYGCGDMRILKRNITSRRTFR